MQSHFRNLLATSACLVVAAMVAGAAPKAAAPKAAKDANASAKAGAKADGKTAVKADAKIEAGAAEVNLKLMGSGAMEKLGGYRPQQLKLAKAKPASVKKAPELSSPLFGELKFGGKSYVVAVDEPKDGDAKVYVDANGNGDLTDDAEVAWEKQTGQGPGGVELNQYRGKIQLPLKSGDKEEMASLGAYRFDPKDPQRAALKSVLLYYSDYAYEGEVTLGGQKYRAMVTDDNATGTFAAKAGAPAQGARLMIDVNADGKFSPQGEVFEAGKPFNIKGTTWAMAPADGGAKAGAARVTIAVSKQKVAEIPLPPNHSVGQKITPFTAKRMDGKTVNFPADYKGKVVLLDFWATWCPPCMAEVPSLVESYKEYQPKGVEILGISLDQPNSAPKVKSVTAEHGMTWPQVYDGKFWKAAVAQKYGINSIPAAFLVDGDTGEILATGGSLRGHNLAETLKKAVEKKSPVAKADDAASGEAKADDAPADSATEAAGKAAAGETGDAKGEAASEPEAKPAKDEKPPF